MNEKDNLETLKGVGAKSAALFSKCKLNNVKDLSEYFPRRYEQFQSPVSFSDLTEGETAAVIVSIHSRMVIKPGRRFKICVLTVKDQSGNLREVVWFNSPFLANVFRVRSKYVFVGEAVKKNGLCTFQHPKYYSLQEYQTLENTYQPVYSLTEGLTNAFFRKCMKQIQPVFLEKQEYLPAEYLTKHNLPRLSDAFTQIHFPNTKECIIDARRRLVFHEFLRFFIYMDALKQKTGQVENQYLMKESAVVAKLIAQLPYQLTNAQKNTLEDILIDMQGPYVMNRLVQGDVGSGKTIVAVLAMLNVVSQGYQAAMMAPTEVLAKQHYESICELLAPFSVRVSLLTGSTKGAEKKEVYQNIANHQTDIIIGTHALIQEKVEYSDLALVITDEQHRFGVKQREAFAQKGLHPHVLVMSATPIPRTLAMMLYGDMSISVMDELPANRLPIKNSVVGQNYRYAAVKFMQKQINEGHQVYVICPMVEESERTEAENVTDYAANLKEYLPTAKIAYLHGKMKETQKTDIMSAFAKGETDILVSTTVIEVGINVPNATFILIENAERFGLAGLHQLRGRVGRGDAQSYCVFMYGKDTQKTRDRLEVLRQSNNGFEIAKEDLKLRGPGDFFGIRQSGELDFRLGDIYQDADLLTLSNEYFKNCQKEHFDFSKYPDLCWDAKDPISI